MEIKLNKQSQLKPDARLCSPTVTLDTMRGIRPHKASYTAFRTRLGWFGLCGTESGLLRACLPCRPQGETMQTLLSGLGESAKASGLFQSIQEQVIAYYEGEKVDFSDAPVCLEGFTAFQQLVLRTLQAVSYGQTVTYTDLARRAGRPKAIRAVGSVMAANPLPLIIPCHRVLRTDGSLGGFSAPGGIDTKKWMLQLEKSHF